MFNEQGKMTFYCIGITVAVTLLAWLNPKWQNFFMGYPYKTYHLGEWHRIFTQGLIHADFFHLLFNMYVLYSFGLLVEAEYIFQFGKKSYILLALLYIGGTCISGLVDIFLYANKPLYCSLGSSASVAAIIFSAILLNPFNHILLGGLISMPSWLFGILYLLSNYYMMGTSSGIAHLAHIIGALYGVIFTWIAHHL